MVLTAIWRVANDPIRQAQAMMPLDVAEDYGGSIERAAPIGDFLAK